ncbi:MAG: PIN domain-containing protein [Pseudomonadota bacterium]|nr:PIN domain-containing protein [Pseudomonadota bacterium]
MNVLVDTTVWIDFFADKKCEHVHMLSSLLEKRENICICGIILTEILQGIRHDEDYAKTRLLLESLIFLEMSCQTFLRAADMYRLLHRRGKLGTDPNFSSFILQQKIEKNGKNRGLSPIFLDCMIAAVAVEYQLPLLQHDRDFVPLAEHCGLLLLPSG